MNARVPHIDSITPLAARIGEEEVCKEVGLFSAWLDAANEDREPSAYFTSISSAGLVREILLNDRATDAQLAAAARELRQRYLADNEAEVVAHARRSLNLDSGELALPYSERGEYDTYTQGVRNRGYA